MQMKAKRGSKAKVPAERLPIRQGEVLCDPIPEVPVGAKPIPKSGAHYMLSQGSSTQHSHQIPAKGAKYLSLGEGRTQRRFIVVGDGVVLKCTDPARHGDIDLEAGAYEVILQREVTEFGTDTAAD